MRINFGKYKGKLLTDVIKTDPNYIKWAVKEKLIKEKELPKNIKL
jgi:uncharacterized protein (DUF3820 family)